MVAALGAGSPALLGDGGSGGAPDALAGAASAIGEAASGFLGDGGVAGGVGGAVSDLTTSLGGTAGAVGEAVTSLLGVGGGAAAWAVP